MTRNVESFTTALLRKAYTLAIKLMENEASRLDSLTREVEDSPVKRAIMCNLNIAKSCYEKCALNLEQIAIRCGIADDRFYNDNSGIALDCDSFDSLYLAMDLLLDETEVYDDPDTVNENIMAYIDFLVENKRMLDFLRG